MYLYFFIHSQSHPKESLNPQVLCTCWSFPSHTALCSIWIGGTETHEDSSQGASSEFLRNSPRQGEPCHPPLGKIGGGPQHVFPQDTVIPSSKGPARTWKIQPTFYRSKTTNKQKSTPLSGDAVNVPGESSGALCGLLRFLLLFTIQLNVDVCMEMSLHPSQS